MKRRTFIQTVAAGAVSLVGLKPASNLGAEPIDALEAAFRQPPDSAHVKTWWHWMNGNVTAEGITLDMEAMHRAGIRGFQIFQVGTGIPKGPVAYDSAEHARLLKHAAREAERLGMEFDIMNGPGWSSSGGPWITPELSMQQLTWSETLVQGGRQISHKLPRPQAKLDYYRDAVVLAFPALDGETLKWPNLIRSTRTGPIDGLTPPLGFPAEGITIPSTPPGQGIFEQLEFDQPLEARSVTYSSRLAPGAPHHPPPVWLEASDDGIHVRKVCDIDWGGNQEERPLFPNSASFPVEKAKFFRLISLHGNQIEDFHLSGAARIPHWPRKANFTREIGFSPATVEINRESIIDPAKVIDISQHMDADGNLRWDAPEGAWTILRIGQTTTGTRNHPAPDGGWGLECDKYSAAAYDFHFDHFFAALLETLGPLAARGMAGAVIDSYEAGMQNWTDNFPEEFQRRRGYDLRPYLPAMTGRVMGSLDFSERFLWDVRRTCADLMADNYYGRYTERCRQSKLKSYAEPYNNGPFEELQSGARLDVPMGEFMAGEGDGAMAFSVKIASSAAHLFGQRVVGAESFTGAPQFSMWQNYPYQLKGQGDLMYTHGVNEFIFHRNALQPHPTAVPGMTMGTFGWECDRTNTIYEGLSGWFEYAARAQSLLRQGTLVADLVYFAGVDVPAETPVFTNQLMPTPPEGYYYDVANEEAILTRMSARDGRIVLPGGMSYRVLILPEDNRLTLPLLRKIRDLVNEGVTVVGPKPESTPGLTEFQHGGAESRQIADEVWGNLDGSSVTEQACGKGRVFWGLSLESVLEKLHIKPDCEITSRSGDAPINFIHRRVGDADVYFVANRRRHAEDLVCTFRVKNRQPELWNPESGAIKRLNIFDATDTGIHVPLHLDPAESTFVVFRSPAPSQYFRALTEKGVTLAGVKPFPAFRSGRHRDVTQNFTLSVWAKPDLMVVLPPQGNRSRDVPMRSIIISPPEGDTVYGPGHASCGLTAGRNGVAVLERAHADWHTAISIPLPIAGWAHLALVYKAGAPILYVDGRLVGQAVASGKIIHPGLGDASGRDGAEYFDGDLGEPELITDALSERSIQQLVERGIPTPLEPPPVEWARGRESELFFWKNGNYTTHDASGHDTVRVSEICAPIEISGPWQVSFPPNLGAPQEIVLPQLISLHQHTDPGVKYFSGTATYSKQIMVPPRALANRKNWYLDLGWVHAVARVRLNDRDLGLLWKPPFRLGIADTLKPGENKLEVLVTNQWVNRLIGDEQLPPENEYTPDGAIKALPEWYLSGKPKPPGGRVTFATWKHFDKDSPLLASGLVGPVRLRMAYWEEVVYVD